MGYDVTSRYTRRNESEFLKIKSYIDSVTAQKKGNYMVFFPSYGYMESVYKLYGEKEKENIIVQNRGMTEQEREQFLEQFIAGNSCTGFCVTGGVFSEGIDLKNESLIGAVIVGTGIPQICTERRILKDYYEKKDGNGYDYAYTYPGMNKVLQAAGRVIRTMDDRGIIILLDDRFSKEAYVRLFPEEWSDYRLVRLSEASEVVADFWDGIDAGQQNL